MNLIHNHRPLAWMVSALTFLAATAPVVAQGKVAAKCTKIHGALLTPADGNWGVVKAGSDVKADQLLVALFGAEFDSNNSAVKAAIIADVGMRGPFPVLEAAVKFGAPGDKDLNVTLDRGILVLVNAKDKGAVHIELNLSDETFDITLSDPKSKLAIEVYGRHVAGPPKLKSAQDDSPVMNAAFFALEGDVVINTKEHATRLHAPPGPALYLWDNLTRMPEVIRFETLPEYAKPGSAEDKKKFEKLAELAVKWSEASGGPAKAIIKSATSADPGERKAAVVALGALDMEGWLFKSLNDEKHADTRDMAILVMRHWLGRANGQSIRFHTHLTKSEKYTDTQAKNLINLFNGINKDRLGRPETYDLLIQALNHSKLPARELARWHLVRLVPDGKDIAYDAAAPEAARLQAIEAWRRLVPEGELPLPPKKKK